MRYIRKAYIQLARHEYGNDVMLRVAEEYFRDHADIEVVEVQEHGGWYLAYLRDMTIVGTANDAARLSDKAREYIDKAKAEGARIMSVDNIRRE